MPNFSSLAGLEVAKKFVWGWGGGWGGLHSHFHVKPNRCVVLCCVEVGVLTIYKTGQRWIFCFSFSMGKDDKIPAS